MLIRTPFSQMVRTSPRSIALLSLAVLLAACNFGGAGTTGGDSSSSSSASSEAPLITRNVSYTGLLETLEVSIYQQGTHKLTTDNGQSVLLQSTDAGLNLDTYIGKRVEVRGTVETTVESGGMLMRVQEVTILESATSSSLSSSTQKMCGGIAGFACDQGQDCIDDPSDSCDPTNGGADCGGICVPASSSSVSSVTSSVMPVASSSKPAVTSSAAPKPSSSSVSSVAPVSSSAPAQTNADLEAQIVLMAKQDYATPSLWTQKYCTSHIAFCIPVHKNWYFKSFGATTSNRWHSEFAMKDITELGQGPIVLNLMAGTSASMNAESGQVKTQGSEVIGFLDWTDGTHFELIADARLKAAVEYMLSHVTAYTVAE